MPQKMLKTWITQDQIYIDYPSGEYKDYWAVNISGNWRIIFRIEDGNVFDVDYLDYH